jgi:hypothetical protein
VSAFLGRFLTAMTRFRFFGMPESPPSDSGSSVDTGPPSFPDKEKSSVKDWEASMEFIVLRFEGADLSAFKLDAPRPSKSRGGFLFVLWKNTRRWC